MSAVNINLQRQLIQFLENYNILVLKEDDQTYHWHHKMVEHKLTKDRVTRFVDAIVAEWISEGTTDITDFQNKLGMRLEDVVRMVQNLVIQDLGAELGVA